MTVTEKKIRANRKNAQHSTGPKTPQGKKRAGMNAIKHGLLSQEVIIEGEFNKDLFNEFRDALMKALKPVGALEVMLADRVLANAWRLRRALEVERSIMELHRREYLPMIDYIPENIP